jgi:CheY-like chemotaxis protein
MSDAATVRVAAILLGGREPGLPQRLREAPPGVAPPPLVALVKRLTAAGINVTVVEDLEEARAVAGVRDHPPRAVGGMDDSGAVLAPHLVPRVTPLLLDLQACSSDEPDDVETAQRLISDCRAAFAGQGPIAITAQAPPRLLLECLRAGAVDVIDLVHEGTARARAVILRAAAHEERRRAERQLAQELRALLDELVRDLVRTERRTIDLEERLDGESPGPPKRPSRSGEQLYLERIKARHEQLLARYLELKGG